MLGLIILPALPRPLASVQGGAPAWTVRSADERRQLRGPVALRSPPVVASFHASSGAASPVANGADFMTAQGGCRSWSVRGADERRQLRGGNVAPDRAAITRAAAAPANKAGPANSAQASVAAVQPLNRKRMPGAPRDAALAWWAEDPEHASVQGGCGSWSVRGAEARRQLRGWVAPTRTPDASRPSAPPTWADSVEHASVRSSSVVDWAPSPSP